MAEPLPTLPALPRREIEVAGIRTSYYCAGQPDARPVILLHGMSASADSFRELMHALAGDLYLLAPDIPGFGYSDNMHPYTKPKLLDWLATFAAGQRVKRPALLGHSFGGAMAIGMAAEQPAQVSRLVLLAPSLLAADRYPHWLRAMGEWRLARWLLNLGTALSRVNLNKQSRKAFFRPERYGEPLWARRADDYRRARASGEALRASALYNGRDLLAAVTAPTAIIWGQDDPVLSPAGADELAALLPNAEARVFLLEDCGHIAMIEQFEAVVAIMREWLA
jgi:pimeloyl-ACP methyl ester carboxylesterase